MNHNLRLDSRHGILQYIICDDCLYCAIAEVTEGGYIRPGTKLQIRAGDPDVAHVYTASIMQRKDG